MNRIASSRQPNFTTNAGAAHARSRAALRKGVSLGYTGKHH